MVIRMWPKGIEKLADFQKIANREQIFCNWMNFQFSMQFHIYWCRLFSYCHFKVSIPSHPVYGIHGMDAEYVLSLKCHCHYYWQIHFVICLFVCYLFLAKHIYFGFSCLIHCCGIKRWNLSDFFILLLFTSFTLWSSHNVHYMVIFLFYISLSVCAKVICTFD